MQKTLASKLRDLIIVVPSILPRTDPGKFAVFLENPIAVITFKTVDLCVFPQGRLPIVAPPIEVQSAIRFAALLQFPIHDFLEHFPDDLRQLAVIMDEDIDVFNGDIVGVGILNR